MKKVAKAMTAIGFISMISATALYGQPTVTVDENGHGSNNGTALSFTVGPDPSGGLAANVLIYSLPFQVTSGDLAITEPNQTGTNVIVSDLIRFFTPSGGNTSELIFYSDIDPGAGEPTLDLADSGIPTLFSPNTYQVSELQLPVGVIGTAPGSLLGGGQVIYDIKSDIEVVPEPASMALLLAGFGVLLGINGFQRKNLPLKPDQSPEQP